MHRPVPFARLAGLLPTDRGLTPAEVEERRARYGRNDIIEAPPGGWLEIARDTARDPMVWFLIATGGLFAALGERAEALVLLAAIVPLLGMDAYLHRRTQASTRGLASRLATRARVLRDGRVAEIDAVDLVPGDLVLVSSGDTFPADGLLTAGQELQADESVLTGEAFPVRKRPLPSAARIASDVPVDTVHWGMAGTRLLTGEAVLRVAYTGGETLYGDIVRSALAGRHARTPLQEAISRLVAVLLGAAAVVCALLAWVRLWQGYGVVDALLSAVTLAVAALPEEFPVVFTFFLGVGIYRLARRRALVRRAVVVENIGRVSAICSDKTGTLTEGRVVLTHLEPSAGVTPERLVALTAIAARAESGDPLDAALLEASTGPPAGVERVASFPFTEDRRRETGIIRVSAGRLLAVVKGAPETVLSMSAPDPAAAWHGRVTAFAASGHKVIACAWQELDEATWAGDEPDRGFRFAGLLAFEDPVREGVREAVRTASDAGIHVIMVTGDHPITAAAVAREIGLGGDCPTVIEMEALEERLRKDGAAALRGVHVVARAIPSQKLTLVRALQAAGEIVAVTGDGVNDVPALQAADIGIAMGERGTRSAREVAAIVLLDDNFRTIVNAIAEGRQLFRNLRLSFAYLLMIHIPLVSTAALIPFAGYPLLYLPVHIVWLELIIHPTALLVFQELPAVLPLGAVQRERRPRVFGVLEWSLIVAVGLVVAAAVTTGYGRHLGAEHGVEHARAAALVALIVSSGAITAALSGLRTLAARVVALGTIASSLVLVQVPVLAALLHLEPLHGDDWAMAAAGGALAGALSAVARLALVRRPG